MVQAQAIPAVIRPTELAELLAEHPEIRLLDVRTPTSPSRSSSSASPASVHARPRRRSSRRGCRTSMCSTAA